MLCACAPVCLCTKDELTTIWAAATMVVVYFSERMPMDGKENFLNFQLQLNYVFKEPFIRSCSEYLKYIGSIIFAFHQLWKWKKPRKMFRIKLFLILFCILLKGHTSMELYHQLQHLIGYVRNHTEAQQPDLMLGIYICEGTKTYLKKVLKRFITFCSLQSD